MANYPKAKRRAQNIVGPQVRGIRYAQGMTQDALAARCEVRGIPLSRAAISKIESGLRCVTDEELAYLALALGVTILDLYPPELRKKLAKLG